MSKNKLYRVIHNTDLHAEVKKNSQGSLYYLFDLAVNKNMWVGKYLMTGHHVSVYEEATSTSILDQKSQYHYTAYFNKDDGKKYRLHIFYDMNDNIVEQPLLSEIGENNTFTPVSCKEEEIAFKLLSNIAIKPLRTELRLKQGTTVNALQDEFNALEKQAELLSTDLTKNKKPFLALMDIQISKLDEIIYFANNTKITNDIKHFLQKLKTSVTEIEDVPDMIAKPPVATVVKPTVSKKPSTSKPSAAAKSVKPAKPPKLSAKKRDEIAKAEAFREANTKFHQSLNHMQRSHAQRAGIQEVELSTLLNTLYPEIIQKEFELEFGYALATVSDLRALAQLKKEVVQSGTNLLQRMLFDGRYLQAKKLTCFYPTLSENILLLSLTTNNMKLLDFLLSNKIFSVNYKDFTLKNSPFSSMIDYCFKMHTDKTSKNDVLKVLIAHGASLMEIDASSGLPFAALLLLGKTSLEVKITDPDFYLQLNQVLAVLCQQSDCSVENVSVMSSLIRQNKNTLSLLQSSKLLNLTSINNANEQIVAQAREMIGDVLVAQLQSDADIIALQSRVNLKLALLLPMLSKGEREEINKQLTLNLEVIKKGLNATEDIASLLNFDDIKVQCMRQNINALRAIDLRIELVDLQSIIQISNSRINHFFSKNKVAQHNGLVRQEQRLRAELNAIVEELNEPFTFIKNYKSLLGGLSGIMAQLEKAQSAMDDLHNLLLSHGMFSDSNQDSVQALTQEDEESDRNTADDLEIICSGFDTK